MKNLLIISALLGLWSCNAARKAEKFYQDHPEKLAEKCATTFPVKDSIIVKDSVHLDTIYQAQEPVILKDSFYIKADTVIRVVTKQCPPAATIIKTVMHDSLVIRRDTAKEAVLQNGLTKCQAVLQAAQDRIKTNNKLIFWLFVILVCETVYIFRKPLLKLL